MRDIPDVLKAQGQQEETQTALTVQALPPGYMVGFTLADRDGQLVVSPGIGNILGARVAQKEEYIIDGNDYVVSDHIIPGLFYTVYVNKDLKYRVDSIEPEKNDSHFAYYHPIIPEYRYIGQFYLAPGGIHQQIVSYDPLGYNSLTTNVIDTLLLSVRGFLQLGYEGTGNFDNPHEGDRTLYIDGDEIQFQVYTAGAWSLAKSIKIGGTINDIFAAFIACQGIYHIENPFTALEMFPSRNFKIFDFENNLEDQYGDSTFWTLNRIAYDSSIYKFHAYSIRSITGLTGSLESIATFWTSGESISAGMWFYVDSSNFTGTTVTIGPTTGNYMQIWPDTTTYDMRLRVVMDSIFPNTIVIGSPVNGARYPDEVGYVLKDQWNYMAIIYDADNMTVSFTLNSKKTTPKDLSSYTWATGTGKLHLALRDNTQVDEFTLALDSADPDIFVQHYQNDQPWKTDYSQSDIILRPNIGGRIIFDDNQTEKSCGTLHIIADDDTAPSWLIGGGVATSPTPIDISSLVPAGTTAILLQAYTLRNLWTVGDLYLNLRPTGSTQTGGNRIVRVAQNPNTGTYSVVDFQVICEISKNRSFDYWLAPTGSPGAVYLAIKGYWI